MKTKDIGELRGLIEACIKILCLDAALDVNLCA